MYICIYICVLTGHYINTNVIIFVKYSYKMLVIIYIILIKKK